MAELNRLRVRAARSRGKARLSLQDLATATGVPRSSLANYLNGRSAMPMDVLDRLLLALGVTPAEAGVWATRWERAVGERLAPGGA
ncbi:helix-turn-helix transcriptional regulator, partial [Micromonospora sp. DH15]|nr:helix-turn-helix transcriptional regulator [Micromonospora sp. DH15]